MTARTNRSLIRLTLACTMLSLALSCADPAEGQQRSLVVASAEGDQLVRIDLDTAESEVILDLSVPSYPRGVAAGLDGRVYFGVRHDSQTVKVAGCASGVGLLATDLDPNPILPFGPGLMDFHPDGSLFVGGDASQQVLQFDTMSGAVLDRYQCANLSHLSALVTGDRLFSAQWSANRVVEFDLSAPTGACVEFIPNPPGSPLDYPLGLTIGHTGNLFVVSNMAGTVQEYDINTGSHVGDLADVAALGAVWPADIAYDPASRRYYLTEWASVMEFDEDGQLLRRLGVGLLENAYGLAIAEDPWELTRPEGVFNVLRVAHSGDEVTVSWTAARALLAGEHFHLLKAWGAPETWTQVNAEADISTDYTETDASVWLQFFDLRAANECEVQSGDEYPPTYRR